MTTNDPDCENLRRLLEELTAENTRLREENTELRHRLALYENPRQASRAPLEDPAYAEAGRGEGA